MSEIIMPKMGDAMTEGKVVRWYKQPGDKVSKGEPVLEIETDKVNLDLEAEADGVLGEHAVAEGATAQVGEILAMIDDGRTARKSKSASAPDDVGAKADREETPDESKKPKTKSEGQPPKSAPQPEAKRPEASEDEEQSVDEEPAEKKPSKPAGSRQESGGGDRRIPSSPLARRMASELGIDLGGVTGTGPNGRVIAADVEAASKSAPASASKTAASDRKPTGDPKSAPSPVPAPAVELSSQEIPLTAMRRTIARRLGESLGPIPHFFLTIDVDVTDLLELRKRVNEVSPTKTSVNDFIVRAAALAIHHHPYVNSSFNGDSIQQHGNVHVGIAVATDEGLITPIVRDADRKGVAQIAAEVGDLAARAKNRKLRPEEYQGSTFTISNLGMFGIEEFTAIINPPNAAILAVGAAGPKPVVLDGQIVVRERMRITMSCDHRVIDGAAGADYLRTLRGYLEQPLKLLV